MKLTIFLIRHSLSCSNLTSHFSLDCDYGPDPLLSNWPFYMDLNDDEKIKMNEFRNILDQLNPMFVFSSTKMRTMETAHQLFPHHIVYPMPYLSESDDEGPLPIEIQKDILNQLHQSINWIDWKYINNITDDMKKTADFNQFIKFYQKKFPWRYSHNIAIISHQGFIEKTLKTILHSENIPDIKNNIVFELVFEFPIHDAYNPSSLTLIYPGFDRPQENKQSYYRRCNKNKIHYQ